jgi:hypothetical protein
MYRLEQDVFGRWIIVHPEHFNLAWSGSRWMPHFRGIGSIAQISNFGSREAADATAIAQIARPTGAA